MNANQTSSNTSGSVNYSPQISPYQNAINAAGSGLFTSMYAPQMANAMASNQALYAQSLPGVTYAAQNLAGTAGQAQNILGQGGETSYRTGVQGLQSLFGPEYEQQQLSAAMAAPQIQYQQNLANQNAGFGGAGQMGSARQALANTALAQQNQLQQEQARAQVASNVAQQRAAAAQQLMTGGQGALGAAQQAAQTGVTAAMTPMQLAQQYNTMLNQFPQYAMGNYTGTQGYIQNTGGAASGGNAGVSILPSLSDITAKENIEFVGTENGHPMYEFNYRGDETRYRGTMAQDIIKYRPDAITIGEDGLMRVNYELLGIRMTKVEK